MTVEPIPAGLWEKIYQRDRQCLCCRGSRKSTLQLAHLISRGKCGKALRWSPKNLVMLCSSCHEAATSEHEDYGPYWNISGKGDLNKNLDEFWLAYRQGKIPNGNIPDAGWQGGYDQVETKPAASESRREHASKRGRECAEPSANKPGSSIALPNCDDPQALTILASFKDAFGRMETAFYDSARIADKIKEQELWTAAGFDEIEEFLFDVNPELDRSKFYRLAQIGRFLRVSGMTDIPKIPERRWIKLLPKIEGLKEGRVDNPREVEEWLHKAETLTNKDYEAEIEEHRNATKHPEIKAKIPQEAQVFNQKDELIGKVQWVRVGAECHNLLISIPHDKICVPLTITIR